MKFWIGVVVLRCWGCGLWFIVGAALLLVPLCPLFAQEEAPLSSFVEPVQPLPWRPEPTRALLLALILPGAGQVYNRQSWKLPIIGGAVATLIWAAARQYRIHADIEAALAYQTDQDPRTLNPFENFSTSNLQNRLESHRRDRDLFYILLGVCYALQAVEAYVAAHLWSFDASGDIASAPRVSERTWQLRPMLMGAPLLLGFSLRLRF